MHMKNTSVDPAAAAAGNHGPVPGLGVCGPDADHDPAVSAVAVTSDPGTDDTHALGDAIEVALTVAGGEVVRERRLEKDRNVRWEITVRPDSNAAVTLVLPATTDCEAEGAICTGDGRPLSERVELTVSGPNG